MSKEDKETKREEKARQKAELKALREKLMGQQQELRAKGLPIIVLVEGWATAGKGSLINELISELDPRFYNVTTHRIDPEAELRYPFLYPYARAIPENGKIMIYDAGWMEDCVRKLMRREITKDEYKNRLRAVNEFERQLRDGGYLILKLFLDIECRRMISGSTGSISCFARPTRPSWTRPASSSPGTCWTAGRRPPRPVRRCAC